MLHPIIYYTQSLWSEVQKCAMCPLYIVTKYGDGRFCGARHNRLSISLLTFCCRDWYLSFLKVYDAKIIVALAANHIRMYNSVNDGVSMSHCILLCILLESISH